MIEKQKHHIDVRKHVLKKYELSGFSYLNLKYLSIVCSGYTGRYGFKLNFFPFIRWSVS